MAAKRGTAVLDGWQDDHSFDLSTDTWWSVAAGPDPVEPSRRIAVIIEWGVVQSRAEPVSITVRSVRPNGGPGKLLRSLPVKPAGPVSATAIRKLALGDVVDVLRSRVADHAWRTWRREHPGERPAPVRNGNGSETWTLDALLASSAEPFAAKTRKGPAPDPDVYVETARIYTQAFTSRAPTQAVADYFGISKAAAVKRVSRARERGLLPPATQGKASITPPSNGNRRPR